MASRERFPENMRDAAALGYEPGNGVTNITHQEFISHFEMVRHGEFGIDPINSQSPHGTIRVPFTAHLVFGRPYRPGPKPSKPKRPCGLTVPKSRAFRELLRKAKMLRFNVDFFLTDGTKLSRDEGLGLLDAQVLADAARATQGC